ncbi:MAG: hypothetical protein SGJ11_03930 [Phycisphaerae bacterium]|nr:hypothetical protein [Phycisphaerae bacterium]
MDTGVIERISVAQDGTQGSTHAWNALVSGNGRFVSFNTFAPELTPFATILLKDRLTGTLEHGSRRAAGSAELDVDQRPVVDQRRRTLRQLHDVVAKFRACRSRKHLRRAPPVRSAQRPRH